MTPAQLRAVSIYAKVSDLLEEAEQEGRGEGPEARLARQAFNGLYELRLGLGLQIERMCSGRQADAWARKASEQDIEDELCGRVGLQ